MPRTLPAGMPTRVDLLLFAIGLVLAVAVLGASVSSVPVHTALAMGSLPAAGGVGYALLLDPSANRG